MDPRQDPETLELFRAALARKLFDESVPPGQLETEKTLAEMADEGLLFIRRGERGYEVHLTAYGKEQMEEEL